MVQQLLNLFKLYSMKNWSKMEGSRDIDNVCECECVWRKGKEKETNKKM